MKTCCAVVIAIAAFALVTPVHSAPTKKKPAVQTTPEPVDPFIKNTVWTGKVAAVDATSISVTSDKALTRKFSIHSGTIFGRGGSAKLAEFKVGDPVVVNFSEVQSSHIARAENISAPRVKKRKAR